MGLAQRVTTSWSPAQIHDTVAAIVREPEFARSGRESLLGRFVRYVLAKIRDLLSHYRGSPSARYIVVAALSALAREKVIHPGIVQQAIKTFNINPDKPNPAIS